MLIDIAFHDLGHSSPIDMRLGFGATYRKVLKNATLARLTGKWDGEDLWEGWDVKRVEEIIKENGWER